MGAPTSEVGYTIATTRREKHEVHKNRWWHWEIKKKPQTQRVFVSYCAYGSTAIIILLSNGDAHSSSLGLAAMVLVKIAVQEGGPRRERMFYNTIIIIFI